MLQHLPPLPPPWISSIYLLLTVFTLLDASNQPLYNPSSLHSPEVGLPEQVVEDQAEWAQHQQAHEGHRSLRSPNSRVQQQDEASTMAEALHSMQTVLSQILANQQGVLANQERLIRNHQQLLKREKYLLSQQKLATPYVSKSQQEHQKPGSAGLHWGKGKILEEMRQGTTLEKEKLRWEVSLENEANLEKEKLGLPDHLQPSRIIISNFR